MDPAIEWNELINEDWDSLLGIYGDSAGGVGIDLEEVGLARARFVRIEVPADALLSPEIDAISDVAPWIPADVDQDGLVNVNDLLLLLEAWGPADADHAADLNGDGQVNVNDLLLILEGWTA